MGLPQSSIIFTVIGIVFLFFGSVSFVSAQIPAYKSWLVNGPSLYTVNSNVGIGTTTPDRLLHLFGISSIQQLLESTANVDIVLGRGSTTNYANYVVADGDPSSSTNHRWAIGLRAGDSNLHVYDEVNNQNVLVLKQGGSVGIGNTNPSNKLTVTNTSSGSLSVPLRLDNDASAIGTEVALDFDVDSGEARSARISAVKGVGANADLKFSTASFSLLPLNSEFKERMRLNALGLGIKTAAIANELTVNGTADIAGRLGVGTQDPATKLQVEGGSDASLSGGGYLTLGPVSGSNIVMDNNEIMARNNGLISTLFLQHEGGDFLIHGSLPESQEFVVKDDGKVGIGENSPDQKLVVRGAVKIKPPSTDPQPTCNSASAGSVWFQAGGTGQKDRFEVCVKDQLGTYGWVTVGCAI